MIKDNSYGTNNNGTGNDKNNTLAERILAGWQTEQFKWCKGGGYRGQNTWSETMRNCISIRRGQLYTYNHQNA